MEINGIFGLLVLIADIFAIIKVVQARVSDGQKILWVVIIILLPLLGLIIWYFAGPGDKKLRL
jgi:hypothetical protein